MILTGTRGSQVQQVIKICSGNVRLHVQDGPQSGIGLALRQRQTNSRLAAYQHLFFLIFVLFLSFLLVRISASFSGLK